MIIQETNTIHDTGSDFRLRTKPRNSHITNKKASLTNREQLPALALLPTEC